MPIYHINRRLHSFKTLGVINYVLLYAPHTTASPCHLTMVCMYIIDHQPYELKLSFSSLATGSVEWVLDAALR